MRLEQRMERSNKELLRRIGEARSFSGERQSTALFDIIQQMMKDQADLQRYLVQTRSALLGEDDLTDTGETFPPEGAAPGQTIPAGGQPGSQPAQPPAPQQPAATQPANQAPPTSPGTPR